MQQEVNYSADKYSTIVPMVTGPISVISSGAIIIMILRSEKKLSIVYHRLLFGLSTADVIVSFAMSFGSLLAPKDSPQVWRAIGNESTCQIQGYFYLLGALAEPLYNCALQIYFLCMIKYSIKTEDIQNKIEPYLHCIPILYGVAVASICLATDSIHATKSWCWIESYPYDCRNTDDCERGKYAYWLLWLLQALPFVIILIFMTIVMWMIYDAVRKREHAMNRHSFVPSNQSMHAKMSFRTSTASQHVSSRKTLTRVLQYYLAFLLAYLVPNISTLLVVLKLKVIILEITTFIVYPLQGFYNFVVFIHPQFSKVRERNANFSIPRALVVAVLTFGRASDDVNENDGSIKSENSSSSIKRRQSNVRKDFNLEAETCIVELNRMDKVSYSSKNNNNNNDSGDGIRSNLDQASLHCVEENDKGEG